MTMATLHVELTTVEGSIFSGEAHKLSVPGAEGELTILPSHAPLLTLLEPGEVKISSESREESFSITGGFMEVHANISTILADAAEAESEINIDRAIAAENRAQKRLASVDKEMDLERALRALSRARSRVKIARHSRRRDGKQPGIHQQ